MLPISPSNTRMLLIIAFEINLPGQWGGRPTQSNVGIKMAAVHFTTIPCEPNTAYKTQGKPNCSPCTKDIVYRRFEDITTLLCLFMNVFKVFVR